MNHIAAATAAVNRCALQMRGRLTGACIALLPLIPHQLARWHRAHARIYSPIADTGTATASWLEFQVPHAAPTKIFPEIPLYVNRYVTWTRSAGNSFKI
jgi:hypothetical protein